MVWSIYFTKNKLKIWSTFVLGLRTIPENTDFGLIAALGDDVLPRCASVYVSPVQLRIPSTYVAFQLPHEKRNKNVVYLRLKMTVCPKKKI
jgi:hypothetical protein